MDDEIKDYIDKFIEREGLFETKRRAYELLDELKSFKSKEDGIIDKIEMCRDIINYITSIQRDNKLKDILGERKIYSFSEFLFRLV